jgi:hypothetical protein
MSAEDKLSAALQMSQTVRDLALAGVRSRFPNADPHDLTTHAATLGVSDLLEHALRPGVS